MNNPIILFSSRLVTSVPNEVPNEEKIPEQPDKNKALLDLIYGVDENTGLPCGDLSMYLSPKTNPEVRNFIEMNLMRDNSDGKSQVSIPNEVLNQMRATITDDDIARFSRGGDESREDYALRVRNYLDSEKERISSERRKKQLENDVRSYKERFGFNS